ncbi:efflux RND transporter periplasmic adaptor subunit [Rhizobium sp. 18055]|uniref:efflux RND transporter periplasmic adaptor subunit n=1 Tax=Rhizobium sp. 18055 TaxID=2681403 RepID=UPI001358C9C5|nr:efflux RND transporter periplasmic adaptor subunit [Rhizobium sp. 18055]
MFNAHRKTFVVTLCVLVLSEWPGTASAQQSAANRPAPSVVVRAVTSEAVELPTENIARVEAQEAVDIRARVPGFIEEIAFKPGASVSVGDLLFVIEPARYQAAVSAAEAQRVRAQALQRQATVNRDRNAELIRRSAVARAAYDDAQAALDVASADVVAAQASLAKAELDLSYTRIVAPISGRIGQPLLTTGNLVGTDSGPIARIVQVDPVRVTFSVAEGEVTTFRQKQIAGGTDANATAFRLMLMLPNGTAYGEEGTIEFVAPEIDPRTGTAGVRVVFPNPDGLLMPGQFVKVIVGSKDTQTGPAIAQSAVMQDRDGRFVFVLQKDKTVQQRRIETGAKIGDLWAVKQGLAVGDMVVVQGMQRLADGIAVQPVAEDGGKLP